MTDRISDEEAFYGPMSTPARPTTGGTALTPGGVGRTPNAQPVRPVDYDIYGDLPHSGEMYDPAVALRPVFRSIAADQHDVLGQSIAQRHEDNRQTLAAINEGQLDPSTDAPLIIEAVHAARMAAARGTRFDTPEAAAKAAALSEEIRREYREWLGSARSERLWAETEKYITARPQLAALLATPGFLSQPRAKAAMTAIFERVRTTQHI